jgi:hypothetical protein
MNGVSSFKSQVSGFRLRRKNQELRISDCVLELRIADCGLRIHTGAKSKEARAKGKERGRKGAKSKAHPVRNWKHFRVVALATLRLALRSAPAFDSYRNVTQIH